MLDYGYRPHSRKRPQSSDEGLGDRNGLLRGHGHVLLGRRRRCLLRREDPASQSPHRHSAGSLCTWSVHAAACARAVSASASESVPATGCAAAISAAATDGVPAARSSGRLPTASRAAANWSGAAGAVVVGRCAIRLQRRQRPTQRHGRIGGRAAATAPSRPVGIHGSRSLLGSSSRLRRHGNTRGNQPVLLAQPGVGAGS